MDRLDTFLAATRGEDPETIALRTLTLHMLEHLAPRLFAERKLGAIQATALERCAAVDCGFAQAIDPDRLQAGLDAWFCRHVRGLPHPVPDRESLQTALQWLVDDDQLIYAWLLGEIATRCGVEARVPLDKERPFLHLSRLHDAYFLTHLVMLDTDYFARPLTHPNAAAWGDALAELVPWLERKPNVDLAGEVALCLRFMKRDARAALALIDDAPPTEDAHAQATVLLARAAE